SRATHAGRTAQPRVSIPSAQRSRTLPTALQSRIQTVENAARQSGTCRASWTEFLKNTRGVLPDHRRRARALVNLAVDPNRAARGSQQASPAASHLLQHVQRAKSVVTHQIGPAQDTA